MQYSFMAETAQTSMAMYNLNLFSNDDIPKYGEEGEDGWERSCAVHNQKWDMVDFQTIREVSYTGATFVCVCDNYHLVSSIDELGGKLIYVTLNPPWLGEEIVADHSDIVRHFGD
jgi:hypothetical protein